MTTLFIFILIVGVTLGLIIVELLQKPKGFRFIELMFIYLILFFGSLAVIAYLLKHNLIK